MFARLQATGQSIDQYFSKIQRLSQFEQNRIALQPIGYDYLSLLRHVTPLPLNVEIEWLTRRVSHFSTVLSSFLSMKADIETKILAGDYAAAIAGLDDVDNTLGASLWSASLNIALRQISQGTEAQKEYVASLRTVHKDAVFPYFINYVSQRCEPTVSLGWFRESLHQRLTGREKNDTTVYMEHKLAGTWPDNDIDFATYLRVEQNHHEIDIYESLINALIYILAEDVSEGLRTAVTNALESLQSFPDTRIDKMRAAIGAADIADLRVDTNAFDAILKGDFSTAYRAARKRLDVEPGAIYDTIALGASLSLRTKATRPIGSGRPASIASTHFPAMLLRRETAAGRQDEFAKFALNLGGTNYADALLAIADLARADSPPAIAKNLFFVSVRIKDLGPFDQLSWNHIDGLSARALPSSDETPTRLLFATMLQKSPERHSFAAQLPEIPGRYASAVADLASNRLDDAIEAIEALRALDVRLLNAQTSTMALKAYSRTGELGKASELISAEHCAHGTSTDIAAIRDVFDGVAWRDMAPFANSVAFCNALAVYSPYATDDKFETNRRFALVSLLKLNGVKLPSELKTPPPNTSIREFVYFLNEVCIPSQLDMLKSVRSTVDVLQERRAICALLTAVDPANSNSYEQELLLISKELTVRDGMRVIDNSRVHVDEHGIRRVCTRGLQESFSRYASLVASGVGTAADFDSVLRDLIRNDGSAKYLLSIPKNEADELLANMLRGIREHFLTHAPHGLDSYLSKRIRHGSIVGHIRGPAEVEGIVLQRGGTGQYVPDGKLTVGLDPREASAVDNLLIEFSRAFDAHLIRLRDVVLHVKTADYPNGLFDANYSTQAIHIVRSALKTDLTIEGLIDSAIAVLWAQLSPSLKAAHTLLSVETMRFCTEQLNALHVRVQKTVTGASDRLRIGSAIGRALTGVQARVDSAAAWFEPAAVTQREYTLNEAIDIGITAVRSIYSDFDPCLTVSNCEEAKIAATYLPIFVDVLYVALGNIAKHANVGANPRVWITVEPNLPSETLRIVVDSEMVLKSSREQFESELDARRLELADGSTAGRIRDEGGSGFHKLASITSQSTKGSLSFAFVAPDHFHLEITLSLVRPGADQK